VCCACLSSELMSHGQLQCGVKVLHRADSNHALTDDLDLPGSRYGFGVSWDSGHHRNTDIDLQCVVVDNAGVIIDCAYYNNLKAVRAITHSGDETVGRPSNIEEMVWVNMRKLPASVSLLVFVVAACSGGSLNDVENGQLHVMGEKESDEIAVFKMDRSLASVVVVAAMFREGKSWKMRTIDLPAQNGQHFMDILPSLTGIIRDFLSYAPKIQKVAFDMEKGSVLDLPMDMGQITVGLGWDVDDGKCDLDVSAILMDSSGCDVEAVYFRRLESEAHGIRHTGDDPTGEGEGDDEQILVNLEQVGPGIQQIIFVINIYTLGTSFLQISTPFCRVVDHASGSELCRYSVRNAGSENGLIIARLVREVGGRWAFHALGLPCCGRFHKESLPQVRYTCKLKTASLMLREQPTRDLSGGQLRCCVLQ